jgi:hypothetical protein
MSEPDVEAVIAAEARTAAAEATAAAAEADLEALKAAQPRAIQKATLTSKPAVVVGEDDPRVAALMRAGLTADQAKNAVAAVNGT